jgi:small subunit ribosomal protein S17
MPEAENNVSDERAQEEAAEGSGLEEAGAEADARAADPAEGLSTKERRRRRRSGAGEPRPPRSPEERARERAEERRRRAAGRRRRRARAGERRRAERPPVEPTAPVARAGGRPRVRQGVVVSDKPAKTIVVRIDAQRPHPVYGKIVRRSSTLHAHDEREEAHEGDTVRVVESRPLSRTKRWRLVEVLERAR